MSKRLADALEKALGQHIQRMNPDASVVVQFAAGDFARLRQALDEYRSQLSAADIHNIADAAEVVSHTSQGQPLPVETRLDMALDQIDLAGAVQAQEAQTTESEPVQEPPLAVVEQMPGEPPAVELPPIEGEGA